MYKKAEEEEIKLIAAICFGNSYTKGLTMKFFLS